MLETAIDIILGVVGWMVGLALLGWIIETISNR